MLLLAFACSGTHTDTTDTTDDTDTPETGTPDPTGGTGIPFVPYEPTWAGMEQLFVDHCDSCHPSQQALDLHVAIPEDLALGYGFYVVPGDPEASKLWMSVTGGGFGPSMPFGDNLLPLEVVDPMRAWIENGALIP